MPHRIRYMYLLESMREYGMAVGSVTALDGTSRFFMKNVCGYGSECG